MGQLFKPGANTIATVSLFLGAAVPFLAIVTGSAISRSPYNTKVGDYIEQPIPFSHKHHAKELAIDCRFCHTSVETSATASVPASDVCMTCHSQVWPNSPLLEPLRKSYESGTPIQWNKVNSVPDFVYFNHSIHVAKGISCNNCHGQIQEMQITAKGQTFFMSWCLECHEKPQDYLYTTNKEGDAKQLSPRQQVFEVYRKVAAGELLDPVESKLARGLQQQVPDDATHAKFKNDEVLIKERQIKKSQMTDCYTCHH